MQVITSTAALQGRFKRVNPNSGEERWRTPFLGVGTRIDEEVVAGPLAFLIEMTPRSVLPPHFHPVDQFQVFVAGSGALGRHAAAGMSIHYADHHTAYGPITAGEQGISYFTLRARTDARGIFLSKPGAREMLKPSKRRFRMTDSVVLTIPPVLAELPRTGVEPLLEEDDRLAAFILRAGAGAVVEGPDPTGSSGQYYVVVNGSFRYEEAELPVSSLIWVGPEDAPARMLTGAGGGEALVLQFPS